MARDHERLAYRLVNIIVKLNQGESVHPATLAREFKVNIRTIQRDLNERFAFLPLLNEAGSYRIDPTHLWKFAGQGMPLLANLVGIYGLYPMMEQELASTIFGNTLNPALLVKGEEHQHEVTLKIAPEIARFFKLRGLLPFQRIVEAMNDGSLIVQSHVAHEDQIIPLVQYWLPHIRIISSSEWQKNLERKLKTYCNVNTIE